MTKSTITRELVHWLHDAATEFASTKLKMTMKPDEVLALTGALLASMDTEPVGWTDEAELRDVEKMVVAICSRPTLSLRTLILAA